MKQIKFNTLQNDFDLTIGVNHIDNPGIKNVGNALIFFYILGLGSQNVVAQAVPDYLGSSDACTSAS